MGGEQIPRSRENFENKGSELIKWNDCRDDLFAEIRCSINFMDSWNFQQREHAKKRIKILRRR